MQLALINNYPSFGITPDGKIYSYPKAANPNRNGKWLKQQKDAKGYSTVTLRNSDGAKTFKVHRLVLETYSGNSGEQVNHIDGNKQNNSLSNLEWVTNQRNTIHAYENKLRESTYSINDVYKLYLEGFSQNKIAKHLGIHQSTVSRVLSGKTRQYARY